MEREREQRDYSELSMRELCNKLYEQKYKLMYELATVGMTTELEAWADGAGMDVDDVTDDLTEHIEVFTEMKAVCEEMLRMVSDKEFDD